MPDFDTDLTEIAELKRRNRAQRSVTRKLRRDHQFNQQHADEIFAALCETDRAAQTALGELWARGEFKCGPEDYDEIVERSLQAIHALRLIGSSGSHVPEASAV